MVEFIGAADIYITPYRHEAQVVSGTLAYALGAGKAIISTPYWHAIELLDDRRGALVPSKIPMPSRKRQSNFWTLLRYATPCANALICSRGRWSGKEWRKATWRVLRECAATAWKLHKFSSRPARPTSRWISCLN